MVIEIREELPEDIAAIREVNRRAFGQDQESNLVDTLRLNGAALLSLVATLDGEVVGHILYSPATISDGSGSEVTGAGLAPMAVVPEQQRHGIGGKLIEAGTQRLKSAGRPFIIVLGHHTYYPRFGFEPASKFGIECEWDVPDDAFMLLVLDQARMQGVTGLAKYRHEFSTVT